jgi:hypothetical protein
MSSPFASHTVSDPLPLPCDPPHTVTVRKLTGREIEAAQEAHRGAMATGSARSWAAAFRRMLEHGASDPEVRAAIRDPLTGYDRFALVRSGLVAWSYPLPIRRQETTATGTNGTVTVVDAVEDLTDEAVDFIATEALRLTKPALFQATAEAAAEEKKSG